MTVRALSGNMTDVNEDRIESKGFLDDPLAMSRPRKRHAFFPADAAGTASPKDPDSDLGVPPQCHWREQLCPGHDC
jgi:hypothetical protein